jgi:hypothetical protein
VEDDRDTSARKPTQLIKVSETTKKGLPQYRNAALLDRPRAATTASPEASGAEG